MEHVVYILYSPGTKRNYKSCTSHLVKRFPSHNIFGKDSTAKYRPWILVHVEFFENKSEALKGKRILNQVLVLLRRMSLYPQKIGVSNSSKSRSNLCSIRV